ARVCAFALHMHCMCIACGVPTLSSSLALADDFGCTCKLGIDPPMLPAVLEEGGEHVPAFSPLLGGQLGIALHHALVGRQPAVLPVAHDEQHISAVLSSAQMLRVREVVVDVERHPGPCAHDPASILSSCRRTPWRTVV